MFKYNLSSSQSDRINFDNSLQYEWTFNAAPDAWQAFDKSLAEDVIEQEVYALEEQNLVDDIAHARERMMDAIEEQWREWKNA